MRKKEWKQVAVLGLGVSGRAAAHWLLRRNVQVVGIDSRCEELKVNQKAKEHPPSSEYSPFFHATYPNEDTPPCE